MQRDLELVAMRAAGAGHHYLVAAAIEVGACAALVVGAITLYAEPRAELALKDIRDQTQSEASIAGVKAGRFKELSGGKRVFYAERVSADEKTLENAFVQAIEPSNTGIMRSDRAYVETDGASGDRFAVFLDGTSYAGTPGALDYVITTFKKYTLRIENRSPVDVGYNVNYMYTGDLVKYDGREFSAEFQWRLAAPIATLLLPALAVLIGIASRGSNWYLGVLIAVSAYFIYTNMLGVGKALIKKDILSAGIGLWAIHAVMILIICLLLYIERRPAGLRRRRPKQELIRP
jgi:lipopolysaccharide export system permease protein